MESALETEDKRILKGDEILVIRRSGSRESNRTERPPRAARSVPNWIFWNTERPGAFNYNYNSTKSRIPPPKPKQLFHCAGVLEIYILEKRALSARRLFFVDGMVDGGSIKYKLDL